MILHNKAILITGASGGIGNAVTQNLSRSKCSIFAHYYKNKSDIDSLVKDSPYPITPIHADFSNRDSIEKMFKTIRKEVDSLDVIINCVGIEDSVEDPLDTEGWMSTWNVNLFGVIETCRQGLNILNKDGVIINISSIMGKHDVAVPIELTSYAVAKTALNKFTLNLAYCYADRLRAVTVSPGYTDTKLWDSFDEEMKEECKQNTPIKRFIRPEEVAKVVRSVIENDAMTAQDIIVDGALNIKLIK